MERRIGGGGGGESGYVNGTDETPGVVTLVKALLRVGAWAF